MIPYKKSFLGLQLIFRVHGSPLYRAFAPAALSVLVYYLLETYYDPGDDGYIDHPYGVGVLISSISFLIIFRANYGYQRYWNACGDVHHMMSKWLDATSHTGVYHMQQKHFEGIKPPSYFDHHGLNRYAFTRDREDRTEVFQGDEKSTRPVPAVLKDRGVTKSIHISKGHSSEYEQDVLHHIRSNLHINSHSNSNSNSSGEEYDDTTHLLDKGKLDGGWGDLFDDHKSTFYNRSDPQSWARGSDQGFASTVGGRTPSLFLQELTHLASLCTAVAFTTLRSDDEEMEAPLGMYNPGSKWPSVDPDEDKGWWELTKDSILYLGGFDKTPEQRARHLIARPLPVIGGVSQNEIDFLQRARGPSAKVNLAWHWLSEFIIREHLAGSLGNVGPPIISRIIQFLGDGMIYYNHARKTMFIPFPFPHAQISAFFISTIIFTVPILMDEYANTLTVGCILTFLTVTCLAGLHEVARELENPFRTFPNEIPLEALQAMFNEALITLYSGYHPDHFWEPGKYEKIGERRGRGKGEKGSDADTFNVSPRGFAEPQSTMDNLDVKKIQKEIAKQQKELERLQKLVEHNKPPNGNSNGL